MVPTGKHENRALSADGSQFVVGHRVSTWTAVVGETEADRAAIPPSPGKPSALQAACGYANKATSSGSVAIKLGRTPKAVTPFGGLASFTSGENGAANFPLATSAGARRVAPMSFDPASIDPSALKARVAELRRFL